MKSIAVKFLQDIVFAVSMLSYLIHHTASFHMLSNSICHAVSIHDAITIVIFEEEI